MILPQYMNVRTQDLPPVYYHTGQFAIGTVKTWLNRDANLLEGTPCILDSEEAVDIDYEEDWQKASSIYDKRVFGVADKAKSEPSVE